MPVEAQAAADGAVHDTEAAAAVPESAGVEQRAVFYRRLVVVSILGAEHGAVVMAECVVAGVTRELSHLQRVVVCLGQDSERAVLGVVPVVIVTRLQVEPQLIAAVHRQLTEQIVAEPVVAKRVVESHFEVRPRTVEEGGPVDVLLDQQRDAIRYRTNIVIISAT